MLRASTEIHVFIVIITALILKNDLSWESIGPEAYDFTLFFSFLLLVPFAAFLAVLSKLLYQSPPLRGMPADGGATELRMAVRRDTSGHQAHGQQELLLAAREPALAERLPWHRAGAG